MQGFLSSGTLGFYCTKNISVISSTRRTDTPAKYISIKASSTELSRRLYLYIMAVSKAIPFNFGTFSFPFPDVVVKFLS